MREREIIRRLNAATAAPGPEVLTGMGDDCAVIAPQSRPLLVTTDTLAEAVHFDRGWHPPELLARKAVMVNLSDINAMGGAPFAAFLSLAVPADMEEPWLVAFMDAFVATLDNAGVTLAGGDTVASASGLVLTVTVLGRAAGRILRRGGSLAGDTVWVSGNLGDAAGGLELLKRGMGPGAGEWPGLFAAHLAPSPPLALGPLLALDVRVHALMDLSDGISTDLAHLAAAAGLGAEIFRHRLPLSDELCRAGDLYGLDACRLALGGGEDYGLLFSTAPMAAAAERDFAAALQEKCGVPLTPLGRIVPGSGVFLLEGDRRQEISFQGFEH